MQDRCEEREVVVLENEGEKIFGVLHVPYITEGKVPAVLICHGLAGHKTGKYRLYVTLAKMLACSGIAALRVDFRGSGDSEGEFHEMTLSGTLSDAMLALDFLKDNPLIDASRIGIFGRSFGGSVAIMAASRFPQLCSIALWAPVFNTDPWLPLWESLQAGTLDDKTKNQVMMINGQVPSIHFYREFFGMKLDEDLEKLKHVPVLHIHGEKDELVVIQHADHYVEQRSAAQAATKFVRLPEADHDFSVAEDQKQALEMTANWFQDTLLTRGERWQQFWKNFELSTPLKFLASLNPFKRWFQKKEVISGNSGEKKGL